MKKLKIHTLGLGPMGTNCYIVESKNDCLIIDPGGDSVKLIEWIKQKEVRPQAILLTHAHFDHIGAVDDARDIYHIPVYLHEEEADWLGDPGKNGSKMFPVKQLTVREADGNLKTGEMTIGRFAFEIRHTPGHSPGSVTFVFHEEKSAIVGDALFQRGIGRTDLFRGDLPTLMQSISNELLSLPEYYEVYPGHGPKTTIGEEKANNPFLT
ncbi:MBL fold metallo-hydrolase [Terribacillus saccharophilus]|uniref:MBL fold metallo-hydrolase n=1 Tax=Terribacillus saccharophilus TaxID=361277 RepID=UPI003981DD14